MDRHAFVDSELLDRAMRLTDETNPSVILTTALEEFIARRASKRLSDLMGSLEWDATYDYKSERSRN